MADKVNKTTLMLQRRYSFRAVEHATGLNFDPTIWTAERFTAFTGIDVFSICTAVAFFEQVVGESVEVIHSIYSLKFTRTV